MHFSPKLFKIDTEVFHDTLFRMLRFIHQFLYFFKVAESSTYGTRTSTFTTASFIATRFLRVSLFDVG